MRRSFQHWLSVISGRLPDPAGTWQRIDDSFAGCLIFVSATDDGYSGVCTYVPPSLRRFGWAVGDRKWRLLKPGWRGFCGEELFRVHVPDSTAVADVGYGGVVLNFLDADRLTARPTDDSRRASVWVRQQSRQPDNLTT